MIIILLSLSYEGYCEAVVGLAAFMGSAAMAEVSSLWLEEDDEEDEDDSSSFRTLFLLGLLSSAGESSLSCLLFFLMSSDGFIFPF